MQRQKEEARMGTTGGGGLSGPGSAGGGPGPGGSGAGSGGPPGDGGDAGGSGGILEQLPQLLATLNDPHGRDDLKLKALQELSRELETLAGTPQYPALASNLLNSFLGILRDTAPQFIGENNTQQLRKLVLEMIQRMPAQDILKQYSKALTSTLFRMVQAENEENVLAALRILIELQKQFRPSFTAEISQFLQFCKSLYRDLQMYKGQIFEPRGQIRVGSIQDLNIESALEKAFSVQAIETEGREGGSLTYTLLPRGTRSLKVLAELPIVVVLLYQIHRDRVQVDISDFIPLVLSTINLFPSDQQRAHADFNRALFVDFIAAQVKALSFLAFLARVFMETVTHHASQLVHGIVKLLQICPPQVAHLRRELLVATRHLMGSELRTNFIPHLSELFDEDLMVGGGWSCVETLRPLVFSALADLVHHVRNQLEFSQLQGAVQLFARCLHDPSLPAYVQAMCGKLMLNLVECIIKHAPAHPRQTHLLLHFMLEVFVRKFKLLRFHSLPDIFAKYPSSTTTSAKDKDKPKEKDKDKLSEKTLEKTKEEPATEEKMETGEEGGEEEGKEGKDEKEKTSKGSSAAASGSGGTEMSVQDCRGLVRVLVCGAKTLSWGLSSTRPKAPEAPAQETEPALTKLFLRLLEHGMPALGIYTLVPQGSSYQRAPPTANIRAKDEKETLEHFASVYWMLPLPTLKEIMVLKMEEVVGAVMENYALLSLPNSLLTNAATSTAFGSILLQHLLTKLPELGVVSDKATLYLKLFKLVFSSVSVLSSNDNEHMLKPHLHGLVERSMELALSAREPSNYFLLLRALFRSIGGGSHDLLYQEFLPLLPSLLRVLNSLQSGAHRLVMRELFVELCLTVPVRLSSLLPYLPLLMDPLVSALNGTAQLVQQGLRTLELCVDNLQPEFLYEHMAPVRAELMQALWRTLASSDDQAASQALRILAKFGGSNRKMLVDPQTLRHSALRPAADADAGETRLVLSVPSERKGPASLPFPPSLKATVPIFPVLEAAVEYLHSVGPSNEAHAEARLHSWRLVRGFLLSAFATPPAADLPASVRHRLTHPASAPAQPTLKPIPDSIRQLYKNALCSMFFAVYAKDLRDEVIPFFNAMIRSLTLQALVEGAGKGLGGGEAEGEAWALLGEGIATSLSDPVKDFAHSAILALTLVSDTASGVLGDAEVAAKSPLVAAIFKEVAGLCYESPWYARLGGCTGLSFLIAQYPQQWVLQHSPAILCALLHVFLGLEQEISSGALDMAEEGIRLLLSVLAKHHLSSKKPKEEPMDTEDEGRPAGETKEWPQGKALLLEALPYLASHNAPLRSRVEDMVERMAKEVGWSRWEVVGLVGEELKSELLPGLRGLGRASLASQTGLLEALAFLCGLERPVLSLEAEEVERLGRQVMGMCEAEDAALLSEQRALGGSAQGQRAELGQLRAAAVKALCALSVVCGPAQRPLQEELFLSAFKALSHGDAKLQELTFRALQDALSRVPALQSNILHSAISPVLNTIGDFSKLSLGVAQRLLYLTRLAPKTFNEKLCVQLIKHVGKWLEKPGPLGGAEKAEKACLQPLVTKEMETCAVLLGIVAEIPAGTAALIPQLVPLVGQAESELGLHLGSVFRPPLLRFLRRFPEQTLDFLLAQSPATQCPPSRPLLQWLLKDPDEGLQFRAALESRVDALQAFLEREDGRELGLSLVWLLQKHNPEFFVTRPRLLQSLKNMWKSGEFRQHFSRQDSLDPARFKTPKTLVKILLDVFKQRREDLELLFSLAEALGPQPRRLLADFSSLRRFLVVEVVQGSSVEWKRSAFFAFLEAFKRAEPSRTALLPLTNVLQHVVLPCVSWALEHGETEALLGTQPAPEQDPPDNLVAAFVRDLILNHKSSSNCLPDSLHILLFQLSCLFVHHAPSHIHDAASKKQGDRLRKFMLFGWPTLAKNNSLDPTTKYYGHLLISNIIDNFAINRKIVLQVFQSLLKAHGQDPRGVIRQALNILTPAVPIRMEDGLGQLVLHAKDIILKDSHTPAQLIHLLNLIVRHYKVFYPVRHQLVHHLMSGAQKLVMQAGGTLENRKLALDVWEMILKWELLRLKHLKEAKAAGFDPDNDPDCDALVQTEARRAGGTAVTQGSSAAPTSASGQASASSSSGGAHWSLPSTAPPSAAASRSQSPTAAPDQRALHTRPMEGLYVNQVVNYLLRMASQAPDQLSSASLSSASASNAASIEALNKKSLQLLKVALKRDVWGYTAELKLPWVEKILGSEAGSGAGGVHMCLDVLSFLVGALPAENVVRTLAPIQRAIAHCLTSSNTAVVRSMYNLLSRLLAHLRSQDQGLEALKELNAYVAKFLSDTFSAYEKVSSANLTALYGAVTTLRALCTADPAYLDHRFFPLFIKSLAKLSREHTNPIPSEVVKSSADMISLCLELVRPRLEAMTPELRKQLISTVLNPLIEKSAHVRVLTAVLKIIGDWVTPSQGGAQSNSPTALEALHRDRHLLLVKLMQSLERPRLGGGERGADSGEKDVLQKEFLASVLSLFRLAATKAQGPPTVARPSPRALSEVVAKLEPAFHRGLAHPNPALRAQFLQVWESSIGASPFQRLGHILAGQNWEPQHQHFWLKQCVYLVLRSCDLDAPLELSGEGPLGLARWAHQLPQLPQTPSQDPASSAPHPAALEHISSVLEKQKVLGLEAEKLKLVSVLEPLWSLCFADAKLSEKVWVSLLPAVWECLDGQQKEALKAHVLPFLVSGNHLAQKEAESSTLQAFVEALEGLVELEPELLSYLGKSHGLWHRSVLLLEDAVAGKDTREAAGDWWTGRDSRAPPASTPALAALAQLYQSLQEYDMWTALWSRRARFPQTRAALLHSQMGQFTQASELLEQAMLRQEQELASGAERALAGSPVPGDGGSGDGLDGLAELELWESEWARCMGELNQWEVLAEFGSQQAVKDPLQVMETAWRVPNWWLMKEAVGSVERSCPAESVWLVHLYRGYLLVCGGLDKPTTTVERCAELANRQLILSWRRLPRIVNASHLPVLLGAQRVMELLEASQLVATINPTAPHPHRPPQSFHDIKAVVKTWRNRTPNLCDNLRHWYDIFFWRLHHYDSMFHAFQAMDSAHQQQQLLLPMHSSAQCLVQLARVARKQGQTRVALDLLNRLHTMPSIPTMDVFMKLYQQLKTCLRISETRERSGEAADALQEGLDILADTNPAYLTKDQTAKLYGLKGALLSRLNRGDEANRAFSTALQLQDSLTRAWGLWAEHLSGELAREGYSGPGRAAKAAGALVAGIQAARQEQEPKARKHLARVVWLLQVASTQGQEGAPVMEALGKTGALVEPLHWLPWTSALLQAWKGSAAPQIAQVLEAVGKAFPQAVLHPLIAEIGPELFRQHWNDGQPKALPSSEEPWKSRAMDILKEIFAIHAPEVSAILKMGEELEKVGQEAEDWRLRCLRHAKHLLQQLRTETFQARQELLTAKIRKDLADKLNALAGSVESVEEEKTEGVRRGLAGKLRGGGGEAEVLVKRLESVEEAVGALEELCARLPPRRLLSGASRYLASFSPQQASVLLFGQMASPKPLQYCVRISRFLPDLELRPRPQGVFTKILVRGHNGKKYAWLLVPVMDPGAAKAELIVNSLLPLLNQPLQKEKEACRRLLVVSPMGRVPLTPSLELVEDQASTTFLSQLMPPERRLVLAYYEGLGRGLSRGGPLSQELLLGVWEELGRLCPPTLLRRALRAAYEEPTEFFVARKQMGLQLAVLGVLEAGLGLSGLRPSQLALSAGTGEVSAVGWAWELGPPRPVPFRLTRNLAALLGPALPGVVGPAMGAAAKAFHAWGVWQSVLPALFAEVGREGPRGPPRVAAALAAARTLGRKMERLGAGEAADAQLPGLITAAQAPDNLARMPPDYHPWF